MSRRCPALRGAWGRRRQDQAHPVHDGRASAARCGNVDCLEVLASGRALVRDLSAGRPGVR
ncbi:hypothetical protein HBB16_13765 [Pseudonocardia sp. MCCB 268]|nr:hypothetical protein [Pseudonocardia cytotoxica]